MITEYSHHFCFEDRSAAYLIYLNGGVEGGLWKKKYISGILFLPLFSKKEPYHRLT